MLETCVAIDLETTGLSPAADEIIEVGAVKFRGSEVVDTFHSMVNPRRALPYRIQMLTGIAPAELEKAPPWAVVAGDVAAFIGNHPVVGQNISFDLGFLSPRGVQPSGPAYDTYELAYILLPTQPDYSLGALAAALGVPPGTQHRALSDARMTAGVFQSLLERAARLPAPVLSRMVKLTRGADWPLARVLASVAEGKASFADRDAPYLAPLPDEPQAKKIEPEPTEAKPLDTDGIARFLDSGGPLVSAIPGFERRAGQVDMAAAVARSFNNGGQLIVEAGTGVGKSVAYLLPSLLFCLNNNTRLVVSTNTINLQEQLVNKDVPALNAALGDLAQDLRVAPLKGRGNYLCLRRWDALLNAPVLSLTEVKAVLRLLVWLSATDTGDRAEVNFRGDDVAIWSKLASPREGCPGERCAYKQRDVCFFYRARRRAEASHVLIVNHALLLSDAAANSKVLPEYKYLVVDEAHHLEREATEQFGFSVRQQDIMDYINRLGTAGARGSGFLSEIERLVQAGPMFRQQLRQWSVGTDPLVREAKRRATDLCDIVTGFIKDHTNSRGDYERQLRLDHSKRIQPAWAEVEMAWENLDVALQDVDAALEQVHTTLGDMCNAGNEAVEGIAVELEDLIQTGAELRRRLTSAIASPDEAQVYWATFKEAEGYFCLNAAPLSVAEPLQELLFRNKTAAVLTSATLSIGGSFDYVKERLGLKDADGLMIGTPFDYKKAALIYIPQDMPEPDRPGYQQALERCLLDLGRALKGRTLVLFTSNAALRATHSAIAGPLSQEGVLVLGQGVDGSAKQLLEALKASRNVIVLGSASFWEGVDVVGEALSLLAIARLPFPVPSDPVFSARCELFEDAFNQYAVPQAVLRFKQGFGRLIRSRTDRGVVVALDRRLESKAYGAAFIDSLPQCSVKIGPARNLTREALAWLGNPATNKAGPSPT